MKYFTVHFRFLRSLSALALLALAACGSSSHEARNETEDAANAPAPDGSFEVASVSEDDLSDQRGGFMFSGGLRVDFGLTSSTQVNGVVTSDFNIHSNNSYTGASGSLPQAMQQVIQVGSGNSGISASPATISNTILTVVQNTTNNSLIQNKNVLNLTVSNLASLRNQSAFLNSFGSMVRALH